MIRYLLKCSEDHSFDSWFNSAAAFEKLQRAGMLSCAVCGDSRVEKAIMAPRLSKADAPPAAPAAGPAPLSTPASPAEKAFAEFRRKVLKDSDYVGRDFVREARRIHEGEAPQRMIHGEARPEDARKLAEDGIAVAPLPFLPTRKVN